MVDFTNISRLDVSGKTSRYTLTQVAPGPNGLRPVIIGRPAAQENKAYRDIMLTDIGDRMRASAGRLSVTAETLDATRARARQLYPQYVIAGWENVYDAAGNEVPFTGEAAIQFINALPNWIFDEMRQFFEEPANFASPLNDAGLVAGN